MCSDDVLTSLVRTYFKPVELSFLRAVAFFFLLLVIFACLLRVLRRFIISQSKDIKLNCTKLFVGVIWTTEYVN